MGQFIGFSFVFRVYVVFCVLVSVPVQSIASKDSSLKWLVMCRVGR